ncbi:ATP-binding cassette subfamily G member 4-like [Ornithodoros turicata]|uniref:ATP-binding cassette subfamily G member 4-like n=1 Tax=Ornithodoros turicata TaxID=34597 RepID=UPI00313889EE
MRYNIVSNDAVTVEIPRSNTSSLDRPNGCRSFETIKVEWKNLTFKITDGKEKGKVLVNNLSGVARPGTLMAIMGPSGAGKTTLLNMLTGYYDAGYEGEVHINGFVRQPELFNKQSCYVMQEDQLLPALTVKEALTMSVELRMPSMTREERKSKVTEFVEKWGLYDCRNTRTLQLSGGQRKRLAIAQELVNNPPVIFLDEPTSGLDSVSSLMCVGILKELAESGHTVVCSIHTPSAKIFSYFDKLYMVSGGRCIYNGRVEKLLDFLKQQGFPCPQYHNPADFISEIAAGEYGDHVERLSAKFTPYTTECETVVTKQGLSKYGGKLMTDEERTEANRQYSFKMNTFHQFLVLSKRCWLTLARNKVATPLRFVAYLAMAVMICMLYYDIGRKASTVFNNAAMIFGCCCIVVFQSILPTVIVFPVEISVLLREHRNCWYSLRMYYLSHYITELPFLTLPSLVLIAVIYYPTSQPLELWRLAGVALFTVQLCSVTQALGLIVSALTRLQTAVFVALPVVSPAFFFSGFFVQSHMVLVYFRWLTYLSPMYHAYQGMLLSIYGYGRQPLDCEDFLCLYEEPAEFLAYTDTTDKRIYLQSLILLAFEATFRIMAFILLKWRLQKKQ